MVNEEDGIKVFQLWDSTGKIVAHYGDVSKLPSSFQLKMNENFCEGEVRNIYRKKEVGAVRLVVNNAAPFFRVLEG